jgi:predicted permease
MATWTEILQRARYMGRRSQFDRELDDEIQFHIETRAEELEADGMPSTSAHEQARREFGSRARVSEDTRGAWQLPWLEDFWRDVCYAARGAARSPGFTAVCVLSLALGVGANCAMFIFVDALLLRPLSVPRSGEVVTVHETDLQAGTSPTSYRDYLDLRDRSGSFAGLVAFANVNIGFASRPGAVPRTKDGQMVSGNYFDVLGVAPALGREFMPEENQVPGRDAVVILGHGIWESELGSDPKVLGKHVWIGGIPFSVVGIMPARIAGVDEDLTDGDFDYYVPLMMAPRIGTDPGILEKRDSRDLTVVGRLRTGITIRQAQAEISAIAVNLAKEYPETNRDRRMVVQTVLNYRTAGFGGFLGILVMTLAGAVLLVACANVAGLLASRAAGRSREIALRLAMGAGRARLIRQLLTESLLLAVAGGAAGVGVGYMPVLLVRQLASQIVPDDPSVATWFKLDERVVLFSVAMALLSVLIFGLAPAFQATRMDLSSAMKGSGAVPSVRRLFRSRLLGRNILVAAQIAISVFLLTISSTIYGGVRAVIDAGSDLGFPADQVLMMTFDPVVAHYKDAQARQFYDRLMERVRSQGGITSVTLASATQPVPIRPEDYHPAAGSNGGNGDDSVSTIWAAANFFEALGIPVRAGRGFLSTDSSDGPDVAVVNEDFAKFYWPRQNPVGRRIRIDDGKVRWAQVIGVAAIKQYEGMVSVPPPKLMFLPSAQNPKQLPMTLYGRFVGDWTARVGSLRAAVRELDPVQAVPSIHHWGERVDGFRRALTLASQIIAAMGAMGILLSLVGLYGLVAYDVSTRTREIGIRMALGAARASLLRMVLLQGLVLAICGIGAGLLLNFYGVEPMLEGFIPPNNNVKAGGGGGVEFEFGAAAVTVLMLAVLALTMLAAYIPARRAASVDPSTALRCE